MTKFALSPASDSLYDPFVPRKNKKWLKMPSTSILSIPYLLAPVNEEGPIVIPRFLENLNLAARAEFFLGVYSHTSRIVDEKSGSKNHVKCRFAVYQHLGLMWICVDDVEIRTLDVITIILTYNYNWALCPYESYMTTDSALDYAFLITIVLVRNVYILFRDYDPCVRSCEIEQEVKKN